ncbi:DUF445 domain-containing protein [Acidiferrobacter sp.]|uniref:DUF445 domain-containing protein n=1 Tax=Acidiferrobacter sp. TaxID=1872107 RepID=UPI00263259C0|nr:DUF445 domain-containing protein [Acidiferrobacter sp.]
MMVTGPPSRRSRDALKRARLRAARRAALILLAAAGLLYAGAQYFRPGHPWLGFVAAFSGAAMIGALADWFAVVALFRHPLGLPLPHTAIVTANKERIADSLGEFIQSQFLSADQVRAGIHAFKPGRRIAKWCLREENLARIQAYVAPLARHLLSAIDQKQARDFLAGALTSGFETLDTGLIAGHILDALSENRRHQWLLDEALAQLYQFLQHDDVRQELVYAIARHMEFVPSTLNLDERVGRAILQRLYDALQTLLQAVHDDHDHALRRRFDEAVADISDRLKTDRTFRARIQTMQADLVLSPGMEAVFTTLWNGLQEWLQGQLEDRDGRFKAADALAVALRDLAASLADRPALHAWIDAEIASSIPQIIARYRRAVGLFIAAQAKAWDDAFLVDQIELNIGRDLQFIRINGTLVGGVVGLILYMLTGHIG